MDRLSTKQVIHYAVMLVTAIIAAVVALHGDSLAPLAAMALVAAYNPPPLQEGQVWVDRPGPNPFYEATSIQNFDGMTTRDYLKYFKDGIKNARDHARVDTRIWAPATTILAGTYDFFVVTSGAEETSLDGGTSITKTDYHTNMQEGKKIEEGATMIIDRLEIEVAIPHREFNAFSADLSPTSAVVTGTDTSSATAHMLALDRACVFELWRGNKLLTEGTLSDFPSSGGFFGAFGGATPEGYIQNGFGEPRYLREVVVLQSQYLFKLKMRVLTGILSVLNVEIRPKLCGVLIETIG